LATPRCFFKMKKAHVLFFCPLTLESAAEGSGKHEPLSSFCSDSTKLANNNNSSGNKSQILFKKNYEANSMPGIFGKIKIV